mmetsp:Transcript_29766/g.86277  ORF Transcript_29766/g.86277 Transcript_29766/m.86277 type:complete len:212 (+) Transcript_29766:1825-2460(+)
MVGGSFIHTRLTEKRETRPFCSLCLRIDTTLPPSAEPLQPQPNHHAAAAAHVITNRELSDENTIAPSCAVWPRPRRAAPYVAAHIHRPIHPSIHASNKTRDRRAVHATPSYPICNVCLSVCLFFSRADTVHSLFHPQRCKRVRAPPLSVYTCIPPAAQNVICLSLSGGRLAELSISPITIPPLVVSRVGHFAVHLPLVPLQILGPLRHVPT